MNTDNYSAFLPYRLEMPERINPILVLNDLYRNQTEFPVWRQCLYTWLKGIFSPDPVWTGKTPADMLYDIEQLERLMEASWLLHLHQPRPAAASEVSEADILPATARTNTLMRYWKWDFYPRWLTEEEIRQPYAALDAFFHFLTLPQWREKINVWLKQCLSVSSGDEFYSPDEVLEGYELLNKLLDATHLIYIQNERAKDQAALTGSIK